jgi:hypothetical protein
MQVDIINHSTDLPLDQFIAQLMSKRVKQGYPEEVTIKVDGEPTTAYTWTDGINYIVSVFLPKGDGIIKEICLVEKMSHPQMQSGSIDF